MAGVEQSPNRLRCDQNLQGLVRLLHRLSQELPSRYPKSTGERKRRSRPESALDDEEHRPLVVAHLGEPPVRAVGRPCRIPDDHGATPTRATFRAQGHDYVIPADARAMVATGKLDRRLFDVTALADFGYDDVHRATAPLNTIRFLPPLDEQNSAPRGKPFLVPMLVQDETGGYSRPRRLTVEASYDEGATWHRVPVLLNLVAALKHPADAEFVSLRASATDRDGNTVQETLVRAYKLRK